ncbi:MAG: SAM-dependent methyltransferase [Actinobacteria bacterium]|nr:SAM-dependent methyltransferase [Actinomycetota bacterium]
MARNWYDSVVPENAAPAPHDIDVTVAHPARVYDYWLGGKDNFAADRAAAEKVLEAKPGIRDNVRANRRFLARAVRFLTAEAGIRQFLDVGTGIPTANNTHEVAQTVAPEARVAYVDNDPIVLTHARALLTSVAGPTMFIDADLRDPGTILSRAGGTLDFSQPVAVMLIAVLHLITDEDDPWRLVAAFMNAVPSGSYLVLSHPARDVEAERSGRAADRYNEHVAAPMRRRSRDEVARFTSGLEVIEPGLVQMHQWRPEPADPVAPSSGYAVVARKP